MKVVALSCLVGTLVGYAGAVSLHAAALQPSLTDGPDNGPVSNQLLNAGLQALNAIEPEYRTVPPGAEYQNLLLNNGQHYDDPQKLKSPYIREVNKDQSGASTWEAGVPNVLNHEGMGWDRQTFSSQAGASAWVSRYHSPIDADMEPAGAKSDQAAAMTSHQVDTKGMQEQAQEEEKEAQESDAKATLPDEVLQQMKEDSDFENPPPVYPRWATDQWQQENSAEKQNDQRVGAPAATSTSMSFRAKQKAVIASTAVSKRTWVGAPSPEHEAMQTLLASNGPAVVQLPQTDAIRPEAPDGQLSTPDELALDREIGTEDHMEYEEKRAANQADQAKIDQTEYSPAEEEQAMDTSPLAEREHALKVAHKLRDTLAQYKPPTATDATAPPAEAATDATATTATATAATAATPTEAAPANEAVATTAAPATQTAPPTETAAAPSTETASEAVIAPAMGN